MEVPNFALIHCPKVGGSSVVQDKKVLELGHMQIVDMEDPNSDRINYTYYYHDSKSARQAILPLKHVQQYFLLFIVRNHFSWLVSYFDWCSGISNWNLSHHDYVIAKHGFDYFVKSIINRDNAWPSNRFIFCQMFTTNGKLVPNHLLHTEKLDFELTSLFQRYNIIWRPQPRLQQGRRFGNQGKLTAGLKKPQGREKIDKRKPWEFYSDKLAEEVWSCWKDEMQLLGYGPDPKNLESKNAIISGDIVDKDIVHYWWKENKLWIK